MAICVTPPPAPHFLLSSALWLFPPPLYPPQEDVDDILKKVKTDEKVDAPNNSVETDSANEPEPQQENINNDANILVDEITGREQTQKDEKTIRGDIGFRRKPFTAPEFQ